MSEKRKVLGRGLESLLPPRHIHTMPMGGARPAPAPSDGVQELPLDLLDPNPYQTRRDLDEQALEELRESIVAMGVIEPIIVRPSREGRYQVIAGERRVKASQLAGKAKVPAVVRHVSEQQAMEITIVENLQREDLNAMEQAEAFQRLSQEFGLTQEQISARTGKERSSVTNFLRLLKLPPAVQDLLRQGRISFGHGKALLALPPQSPEVVVQMAMRAVDQTVRQTEQDVASYGQPRARKNKPEPQVDPNVRAMEEQFRRALGSRVSIRDHNGRGRIMIYYGKMDEFDHIYEIITGGKTG